MTLKAKVHKGIQAAFAKTSSLTGPATLRKRVSTYDPASASTTIVTSDSLVDLVFDDSEESGSGTADIVKGERIAYIYSTVKPEKDDLIIGPVEDTYTILGMALIISYDEVFLYKLILRQ